MKNFEPDLRDTYQTGSTNPPKNHTGIIAVLLIAVTVLVSVVTVLGMMNIQLFQLLREQSRNAVYFESAEQIAQVDAAPQVAAAETEVPMLGLTFQEVTGLYRSYHQLPYGLYISQVDPESAAAQIGIRTGDILIACDGKTITKKDSFIESLSQLSYNTTITLTVYRDNQQLTFPLTVNTP